LLPRLCAARRATAAAAMAAWRRGLSSSSGAVTTTTAKAAAVDMPDSAFEETHTGQRFEPGDYRLARFVGKQKLINKQQAIDLVHEVPPIPSQDRVVHCDGGDPALGHPRVYINLDGPGPHICGYCGLRYFYEDKHHH
ncbi:hypothetical protein BOX15_Mlig015598g1, partial [Macrostomum lignano]